MKFSLKLISPEGIKYEGEVDEAILPTANGQIGVLANHQPLVALLCPGEIILKEGGKEHYLATDGGIVKIANNQMNIVADGAQYAEELEELKIIEARERAKKSLSEAKDEVSFTNAAVALEKILASEKVLKRRRRQK